MDVLTHVAVGILCAQAAGPIRRVSARTRLAVAGLAAAVPDLDYLLFWVDPFRFHMEWHRGPTHSLVLLPLWAMLLATLARLGAGGRLAWRDGFVLCALALASHALTDLITAYGIQLFYPVSDRRYALDLVFVIDPWFSAIAVAGLALSFWLGPRWALLGVAALALYVGWLAILKSEALDAGRAEVERSGLQAAIHAYPQPLSPLNWLLVATDGNRYRIARVHLGGPGRRFAGLLPLADLRTLADHYRPRGEWQWFEAARHGDDERYRALAARLWEAELLAPLRRFAYHPLVYRVDATTVVLCVWYTDLVFTLPDQVPPFRYGLCGSLDDNDWHLSRLPMFGHGSPLPW